MTVKEPYPLGCHMEMIIVAISESWSRTIEAAKPGIDMY